MTAPILTVCAWCRRAEPERITILRLPDLPAGAVLSILYSAEQGVRASILTADGSEPVQISDGICDACKAIHFPPAVRS